MSGIEVAGLVLGCLPLIIQAIESYNEGLDPIKGFFGRDKELPIFIRKLRAQYDHYDQTIQLLFGSITSDTEFVLMMADPASSQHLWKSKEAALQDKLQNTYKSYQRTMMDIEKITTKIASKLDLDRAAELSRNELEALLAANPRKSNDKFEIRKRVRFGMNKKTIKALLEELDECNKSLERFTEKSEKIETYHRATKPSYATRLQKLQRYAKALHESLSVCWSCSCKSSHRTSLQLEARENVFASRPQAQSDAPKISFRVAFSTTASDRSGVPWLVQAAEICVEDEDECLAPTAPSKPKMAKSVSFGTPPPYAVLDPTERPLASRQEVKDLCASIQQVHKKAQKIGFLLDSKSKLRGAYSIDTSETYVPSMELVSLEDLLGQPPVVNGRRSKLSMRDRYSLAVTLASSVLYLNSTPWLANEWAARDILFHQTSNTAQPIRIDRPYLAPAAVGAANGAPGNTQPNHFRNTVLIALAVTLLELYFGVTAEKYQQSEAEGEGADTSMSKQAGPWKLWALARSWTFNEAGNLSAAFQNAIRHCITGSSDPCASLDEAEFLQAAVENIVLPLQEELDQFLGKATK